MPAAPGVPPQTDLIVVTDSLDISQFDYELPRDLIAQHPTERRDASRLLHLDGAGALHDRQFTDLPDLLRRDDLLVFNNTRVIKARLRGHKESGGQVEVLVERILDPTRALAHIRASKAPREGARLLLEEAFEAVVLGREDEFFKLQFPESVLELLDRHGSVPLPPYITHPADKEDEARYQTVYAEQPGAVAAPTAGLHFDEVMLDRLAAKGIDRSFITLHVGAGTFQPVRVAHISDHVMHAERYRVPADTLQKIRATRDRGGRVIAVGTTSVRALEAAAHDAPDGPGPIEGDTRLFITPGYQFRYIDALITNFHLPQSTLLMLVSALAGMPPIRQAYEHAVQSRYRFFSYGDAMLIEAAHAP